MRKTWVLDTETKGTGANVVPLEKVQKKPEAAPAPGSRRAKRSSPGRPSEKCRAPAPAKPPVERTATLLPPGHVRSRTTGEIGQVRSVDSRAGTATVHWLKRGAASTVPLSAISRR